MNNLKNHDLVRTFCELKGNPKWSIITEPLWYIPYALFAPFASLYMSHIGLSGEQIGLIISIGFVFQMACALIGGVITDKLGRRNTTIFFDLFAWSIPCFIWAFAQNFWWFLAAAIINSLYQITNTSWSCLFIEDCEPKHLTNAFTLIQLCGMLSVFFSPIAIVLVDAYSVVQVVSVLYIISGISMTLKFFLLYIFGGETKIGKQRLVETKGISYLDMFRGYGEVFLKIIKSKSMRFVVVFMGLTNIVLIATTNFFSLYITEHLNLPTNLVPVFPLVRTAVMLLFVIALQNVINTLKMNVSLVVGFGLFVASHILLIVAPPQNITFVILYTVLEAAAHATVYPRKDALMAFYVMPKERSRVFAIFNTGMIALSAPFGYIIGVLYAQNYKYPFIFNIVIFAACILLSCTVKAVKKYDENVQDRT